MKNALDGRSCNDEARELLSVIAHASRTGQFEKRNPYPQFTEAGQPNEQHYVWELIHLRRTAGTGTKLGRITQAGYATAFRALVAEASHMGIDLRALGRSRHKVFEDPKLLEMNVDEIEQLEKAFDAMDVLYQQTKRGRPAIRKKWLALIKRARQLKERAFKSPLHTFTYMARDESGRTLRWDRAHFQIQRALLKCIKEKTHYLLQIHPGAFKTMTLTGIVTVLLMENPGLRIAVIRHNTSEAEKIVKYMKSVIRHRRRRALFPEIKFKSGTTLDNSKIDLQREDESIDPNVIAYGILSAGEGIHCDIMFMDDPCPARVADEPSTRERIKARFWKTWTKRLVGGAVCIIDGYSFSTSDLYQEIIAKSKAGTFRCYLDIRPAGGKPHFTAPAPSAFDSEQLKEIYDQRPADYDWFYRLRPMDDSKRVINQLCYYQVDKPMPDFEFLVLSVDPAASTGKGANPTGVGIIGLQTKGPAYLLAADRVDAAPEVMEETLGKLVERWKPSEMVIESVIGFRYLAVMMQKAYPMVKVRRYTAEAKAKLIRLRNTSRFIIHGDFLFPSRDGAFIAEELNWLADQLLFFGTGVADDGVDMVTQTIRVYGHKMADRPVFRPAKTTYMSTDKQLQRDADHFVKQALAVNAAARYDSVEWMALSQDF